MGGLNMPKGMVKAICASNRLVARRTCGTRGGPTARRHVARSLAEATELALAQRPVHDDGLGRPALHRHGRVGDRRARSAPTGEPRQAGVAQLGQSQIGGHEGRFVAVLGERRQAVDVVGAHAGVGDGGEDRLHRQLVLAPVGDAAPFGVAGLTHADHTGSAPLGRHRADCPRADCPRADCPFAGCPFAGCPSRRGADHSARTSWVCSPSSGGRRSITHGEAWARKGAPA